MHPLQIRLLLVQAHLGGLRGQPLDVPEHAVSKVPAITVVGLRHFQRAGGAVRVVVLVPNGGGALERGGGVRGRNGSVGLGLLKYSKSGERSETRTKSEARSEAAS